MKNRAFIMGLPGLLLAVPLLSGFQSMSPKDILDRSVKVHGGDKLSNWKSMTISAYKVAATSPAYVLTATIGKETFDLYIDKENFHFLQEVSGRTRRVFWNFKKFGDITLPTQLLEITAGSRGEQITPYTYETVKIDAPIEDWIFTEDMPKIKIGN